MPKAARAAAAAGPAPAPAAAPRKARAAAPAAGAAARAAAHGPPAARSAPCSQLRQHPAYLEELKRRADGSGLQSLQARGQHAAKAHAVLCGKLFSLPTPKKNEPLLRVLRFAEQMMQMAGPTLAAGTGEGLIAM